MTDSSSGGQIETDRGGRAFWALLAGAGIATLAAVATLVLLVLPMSVHVDTAYGSDIFFDCGLAVAPATVPNEEPGITACDAAIGDQQQLAASAGVATAVLATVTGMTWWFLRRGNPTTR